MQNNINKSIQLWTQEILNLPRLLSFCDQFSCIGSIELRIVPFVNLDYEYNDMNAKKKKKKGWIDVEA